VPCDFVCHSLSYCIMQCPVLRFRLSVNVLSCILSRSTVTLPDRALLLFVHSSRRQPADSGLYTRRRRFRRTITMSRDKHLSPISQTGNAGIRVCVGNLEIKITYKTSHRLKRHVQKTEKMRMHIKYYCIHASWGGTSKDTVLRSTFV